MTQVHISNIARDGEKRTFKAHGHALVGGAGAAGFTKGVFEPGWRWSDDVKPIAGTDTCQVEHVGYAVSGTLHVKHDDGTDADVVAGQVYRIAPGHDAWNEGSEPAVFVEFQGAGTYAKR